MASHASVVVKIIPKYVLQSAEEKQSVIREEIIHRSCRHAHIIRLIDTCQDEVDYSKQCTGASFSCL